VNVINKIRIILIPLNFIKERKIFMRKCPNCQEDAQYAGQLLKYENGGSTSLYYTIY